MIESELVNIFIEKDFTIYDRDTLYEMLEKSNCNILQTNLIVMAFDAGIIQDISEAYELDEFFVSDHVKMLVDNYGLTEENASWVVKTLCKTYGEKVIKLDYCFSDENGELENEDIVKSKSDNKVFELSNNKNGAKIPKSFIKRVRKAEKELDIEEMNLTAIYEKGFIGNQIKIVGEIISNELKADTVIFIMIYNDNEEMIGTSFEEKIYQSDCKGIISFSESVDVPDGELISKIVVRPIQNPASFWRE